MTNLSYFLLTILLKKSKIVDSNIISWQARSTIIIAHCYQNWDIKIWWKFYLDAISMLNNLISKPRHYTTAKTRETLIQQKVLIPTVTAFAACSWPFSSANELEILLPNTTLQASLTFSSHLQLVARNSGQEHWLVNLHSMWSDVTLNLHFPWEKCQKNEKPHIISNYRIK